MDRRIIALMLAALLMLTTGPLASADEKDEKDEAKLPEPAEQVAIIKAVSPSLVRVEYTMKFDKGQAAPGCEQSIRQERALEQTGFLLSPRLVITEDITEHPRFINRLFVSFNGRQVEAAPKAYFKGRTAMLLELAKPLEGAKPLVFAADAEEPFLVVHYGRYGTTLTKRIWPMKLSSVYASERNSLYRAGPSECLIVDAKGRPVAISMASRWPIDDSWKGSPLKWPTVQAGDLEKTLDKIRRAAEQGLMRVTLNFRSPRKKERGMYHRGGDESQTERNTVGALIDKNRVLVLAPMSPKVTARLERVTVHPQKGEPVPARFKCTLKDYGGFVAVLDKPLSQPVKFTTKDIRDYRYKLLLAAKIVIQGKKRVAYYRHSRITSFDLGWKRHVYPDVGWGEKSSFFFSPDGTLLAMPIARREKVSVQKRWGGSGVLLTNTFYLKGVFDNLDKNIDIANIPLTEEEESRLAWIGMELQRLNKELARMKNISDLTRDGSTGAIVSYVYPGSPADTAGVKAGDILLRIHAEDQPKPIDVNIERYMFAGRAFPWDQWDQLPEHMFDHIPTPWPSRENTMTRALTDLGFGKKFQAEFFIGGKSVRKDFKVVTSPPHYDTAPKHKSEQMGMTVRNLTYELRRYFQKKPDDPGVIISKIKPGSKASVSGLKPYEIITHVKIGQVAEPVKNVDDFKRLIKGRTELQLSVKRMARGRIVKIKLPESTTKPATDE